MPRSRQGPAPRGLYTKLFQFWVAEETEEDVDELLAQIRPRVTKAAFLRMIVDDYIAVQRKAGKLKKGRTKR